VPVRPESIPISVDLAQIRVVLERVQVTHPEDSLRSAGPFVLTARLTAAGTVIANHVIELEPAASPGAIVIDLDRVLYEGILQGGELLRVELFDGPIALEDPALDQVRYRETVVAPPSAWIGRHSPSRAQPWPLWYRVEPITDSG
jgi:hypothetical protein